MSHYADDQLVFVSSQDTPRIDAVLQQHKRRSVDGRSEQDASTTHESRLLKLENQLTGLLLNSSKKSCVRALVTKFSQ